MIGVIGAMDNEVKDLVSKLQNLEIFEYLNYKFYKGIINNKEVVITRCGVGKVNSAIGATLMISKFSPEYIINSGIAGGANGLVQYDVVLADELTYSDVDVTGFSYELGQIPGMPCSFNTDTELRNKVSDLLNKLNINHKIAKVYSADSFILSLEQLKLKPTEPTACEMEGASIAQVCHIANTKFLSLRFISDVVGGSDQSEAYNIFEEKASKLSSEICYKIISNI